RLGDRLRVVGRDVVGGLQAAHVAVVADHYTLEAEPVAQLLGEQEARRGRGHAVDRPGIHHHGRRAGVDPARIRGQEGVLQIAEGQLRLDPVVSVDRLGVAGEVLYRGRHLGRVEAAALHPADAGGADRRGQHRRLGPRLVVAAPAVVPRQVLDRGEVPVAPGGQQLPPGGGSGRLRQRRVPGGAHADRLREQRRLERVAEAVDRVDPVDDRDVQSRVLDRVALDGVVLHRPAPAGVVLRVVGPAREDRDGVLVDQHLLQADRLQWVVVAAVAVAVGRRARRAQLAEDDLVHLADLLLQRHAAQQVLNARGNRCLWVEVPGAGGRGALGREQGAGEGEHGQKNGGDGEPFPPPDHLSLPRQFGQRRRRGPSHWTHQQAITGDR